MSNFLPFTHPAFYVELGSEGASLFHFNSSFSLQFISLIIQRLCLNFISCDSDKIRLELQLKLTKKYLKSELVTLYLRFTLIRIRIQFFLKETRDLEFHTNHKFFLKSSIRLVFTPLCPVVTLTLAPLMLDVIFKTQSLNIAAAYEKCFCIPRGQKTMHKVQILDHAYLILQSKYWGGVQLCTYKGLQTFLQQNR